MQTNKKEILIKDIQQLLNSYDNVANTTINPALLEFMDEETLISIIGSLLDQKETHAEADNQWLEQFKKNQNE